MNETSRTRPYYFGNCSDSMVLFGSLQNGLKEAAVRFENEVSSQSVNSKFSLVAESL